MRYLKDSFSKFKKDVLSKVFYDLLKYLFITFILVLVLKYVPIAKEKLELELSITLWVILIYSLVLIGISLTTSYLLFNKRFKKIQADSQIDELTGLKNYKALELDIDNLISNWNSNDEPISFILLDIDDFKKFNEDNSYEVADKILTKLGNLLTKDSRITDETYRYFMRGDEFLIIAKKTSISNAQIAAERKRKLIADSTFNIDGKNFNFTVSCGVTEYNQGELKSEVLERVNQALQSAKKKPNKNCTEIIV
ncbi:GGDEF domain-containing protein [Reichenbachiella agarivorans]|uniref:diguanylate cyclase n=1 Tax=Reichenbachiella agarivorans TaxID=2979464 RepID=A0ABY6CNY8_9BACT|nr:GGDEF domain-containing protein [Reichenbachiella agarivorans]UXP32089.1 GGDEF domain-containing protein [Reichenbachiella agarivorans]